MTLINANSFCEKQLDAVPGDPGGPAISHHSTALKEPWAVKSSAHFIFHKECRSQNLSATHTAKNDLPKAEAPGRHLTFGFLQKSTPPPPTATRREDVTGEALCPAGAPRGTSEEFSLGDNGRGEPSVCVT